LAFLLRLKYAEYASDSALREGKYHMFECIPLDGAVNEAGLQLVIDEEKATGKLAAAFLAEEILLIRFVKEAAESVDRRFGSGCE
jgi:hypothetical protein